jgi:hypothetical protein
MRSCRHAALRVNSPTQPMRPHPAARPTHCVLLSRCVLCRCDTACWLLSACLSCRCSSRRLGGSGASTGDDTAAARRAAARCTVARRTAARCAGSVRSGGVAARRVVGAPHAKLSNSCASKRGDEAVAQRAAARYAAARRVVTAAARRTAPSRRADARCRGRACGCDGSAAASRRWAHHSKAACAHSSCLCVLLHSYSSATLRVWVQCYCDARATCSCTATGGMMGML